jgi:ankyrin repeat protein
MMKLLNACGRDPHMLHEDHDGHTQGSPLYCAAWVGTDEIEQFLIDQKVDVNKKFHIGKHTSLHAAAPNGHFGVAVKLLANGANVNAKDPQDHTALDRAKFASNMVAQSKNYEYGESWFRRMYVWEANAQRYPGLGKMLIA